MNVVRFLWDGKKRILLDTVWSWRREIRHSTFVEGHAMILDERVKIEIVHKGGCMFGDDIPSSIDRVILGGMWDGDELKNAVVERVNTTYFAGDATTTMFLEAMAPKTALTTRMKRKRLRWKLKKRSRTIIKMPEIVDIDTDYDFE